MTSEPARARPPAEAAARADALAAPPERRSTAPGAATLTPTGRQSADVLFRRRALVAALNLASWVALVGTLALVLSSGGLTALDLALLALFALGTPWTVLGFWNALIGFLLLRRGEEAGAAVTPLPDPGPGAPVARTAVLMTLRNEDAARAIGRFRAVHASVGRTGQGAAFAWFVLSDSDDPDAAAAEERAIAAWRAGADAPRELVYRRRTVNTGFKAGNVREFCDGPGREFELMLPLDADSLMTGDTILRHARIMTAHPKLGILQSLVTGQPSESAFARVFQFGMRAGMRTYTAGQAWWVGDCGPYWGHNALVRIAPFREHCHLPVLPGPPPLGGAVLSHDQVEATLMRRAGYEVRVLPEEGGSYEENPPTILDFAKRDLRWCLGNLQYLKLLDLPGLKPVSRFQLVWAILMFAGIPAWTGMIALLPLKAWEDRGLAEFPVSLAIALYAAFFFMSLSPKLFGVLDILLSRDGQGRAAAARYGGRARVGGGAAVEIAFSFLQGAVSTLRTTIFMAGLALGRARIGWNGQARDARGLSVATAWAGLWPHALFAVWVFGGLALANPALIPWTLPLTAGYALAVPFAVLTASPALGRWLARARICAIPEEFAPVPEFAHAARAAEGLRA